MKQVIAIILSSLVVGAWTSAISAGPNPFARRDLIVGGEETTIENYPHQASLQLSGGNHFCGASLISLRTLLTAAHCVVGQNPASIFARLGSSHYSKGGVLVAVSKLIHHEKYDPNTLQYDVGLVILAASVAESKSIRVIELGEILPPNGARAEVTGWGTEFFGPLSLPDTLQKVSVRITHYERCSSNEGYGSNVGDTMICGYEDDTDDCQRDPGGPLVSNNVQIGIVSWGYGCTYKNYPAFYCSIESVYDWILANKA